LYINILNLKFVKDFVMRLNREKADSEGFMGQ
jgi:hypothetical protein